MDVVDLNNSYNKVLDFLNPVSLCCAQSANETFKSNRVVKSKSILLFLRTQSWIRFPLLKLCCVSEMNQTEKDKDCMIALICGI